MATDYDGLDEATLQRMANEAESYEERSAIRQAIRRKKKDRGENVGRAKARGNSVYNRFAGSTAPSKQAKPKNYVITEAEQTSPRPPSSGGRGSSRGSTTPTQTQKEISSSPVPRPRTPTPPPTPEQPQQVEEEASLGGDGGEPEGEEDDVPIKEKEAPLSPPPSPQSPAEVEPDPPQQQEEEEPDGEERTPVAALPEEEKQDEDEEEDGEPEREEERAPSQEKEEPPPPEEEPASPKQDRPARRGREDTDCDTLNLATGGARFGGVTLKSRGKDKTPTPKLSSEPQNEFLNLKLRQTSRDGSTSHSRRTEPEPKVDFGVKLKSTPREKPTVSPPTHKRAKDSQAVPSSSEHSTPRTLRDYQELSSKSSGSEKRKREQDEDYEAPAMEPDELQKYLVAYVNSELSLHPPLPVRGGALYEACSNPTNLCKLVNKSVPNTVDLRALSKISASASDAQRKEALKENMTLALESARAIGCRVTEASTDDILGRNPQAIRDFLVDLIRAKAVNLPGMDDEPSSTFTNMVTLFEKLNISVPTEDESVDVGDDKEEEVSWRDDPEKVRKALESPTPKVVEKETWRDSPPAKATPDTTEMSYEERAAMRRAQRERRARQAEESGGVELSYEERAAQRRAERERRRKEREALAK